MGAYVTERLPQLNTLPLYARQRCAGMLILVVAIMVEVLRRDLLAGNHSVRNGTPCDEGAPFAAPK